MIPGVTQVSRGKRGDTHDGDVKSSDGGGNDDGDGNNDGDGSAQGWRCRRWIQRWRQEYLNGNDTTAARPRGWKTDKLSHEESSYVGDSG